MFSQNEVRIVFALFLSMGIHVFMISRDFGISHDPVASPARKKVTFQLVSRQVSSPAKEVRRILPEKVEEQNHEIEVEVPAKKKPQPEPVQPVPQPVEVQVKEIPAAVRKQVVKKQTPQPVTFLQEQQVETPVTENGSEQAANPVVVLARPLYRQNPPPSYPAKARRKRQEGTVVLEVLVNREGRVKELHLKESSGYKSLDRAAVSSVRKWVFEPGRRNGLKTAMTVLVPVRFKLH